MMVVLKPWTDTCWTLITSGHPSAICSAQHIRNGTATISTTDRCRGTGFTTDIDLADLIGMWMSYRPSPWSTDTSSAHSSVIDSSFESDAPQWHPEQPHLTATMPPPQSPSVHSHISSNQHSPPIVNENDDADAEISAHNVIMTSAVQRQGDKS